MKSRPKLEEWLGVACMVVLTLITLGNVLTRYLTDQSFAWTEEISVFLIVVMTLAGAAASPAATATSGSSTSTTAAAPPRRRRLRLLAAAATVLVFVVLAVLFGVTVADEVRWAETSMGLGVPRWWFTVAIPPLCVAIAAARRAGRLARLARSAGRRPGLGRASRSGCDAAAEPRMIATLLVVLFVGLMLAGVPIAVALGLGGMVAIAAANAALAVVGPARGAAEHARAHRQVPAARAADVRPGRLDLRPLGRRPPHGHLRRGLRRPRARHACRRSRSWSRWCSAASPGSGPANAAAVGGVMIAAMAKAGYPAAFSASVVGAAAATDILIPPSIAFIVYSVNVPGASVPALFAAGMVPGILAGLALIVPAVLISRRHGFGAAERGLPRPPFWRSLARRGVGPGGAGADPRRHARRLVHADRSGGRRRRLRPLHRHGGAPLDRLARPLSDLSRGDRDLGGDHAGARARRDLRLLGQHARHRRSAGRLGQGPRPRLDRHADPALRRHDAWSAWCSTASRSSSSSCRCSIR